MTRALVFACIATLLHPPSTGAARRKRPAHRGHRSVEPRSTPYHGRSHGRPHRRPDPVRGSLGSVEEHVPVRRGDTLESILVARGVGVAELTSWLAAAADVFDPRGLQPHRSLILRFDRATRALDSVRYEIDGHTLLVLQDTFDGIRARREPLPYFIQVKGIAGRIERGLREDAAGAGVPERVVADVADVFAWDVDVGNGLRPGDEFRVLYENLWETGLERPESRNLLGAQLVRGGRPLTAIYFEDRDGRGGYYQPSGEAVSRRFLRYPVEFTEISSEFSLLRHHPILHVDRPHLGVDFAAPRGAPVRAVAGGRVSTSGWVHGLGRCVRIDHTEAVTSVYGHLSRFAAGLRTGAPAERGQVIGYVGSTGLATGPHLHYALERDGEYVDPLVLAGAAEDPVPAGERRSFERVRNEVIRQLAGLPETARPTTVSLSVTAYPSAAYRVE